MKRFLIAGGDLRFVHVANLLSKENTVYVIGMDRKYELEPSVTILDSCEELEQTDKMDYAILPLPATSDYKHINTPLWQEALPIEDLLSKLSPDTLVFLGKSNDTLKEVFDRHHLQFVDYFSREELAVMNAVPTAEGTIQIAMEELPVTLYGAKCLIAGYGRIGKYLAKSLSALGAKTAISARSHSDLATIKMYGYKAVHTSKLKEVIGQFDLIINTVPAKVFDKDVLKSIQKSSLLIDLASKPGGVEFDTAKDLGVKTIWALSLPGIVAPITAGEIIYQTIANMLDEQSA